MVGKELTSLEKITIARKVADALVYMHDIKVDAKRVMHRDIRVANVLLTDKLEPMLTGFELWAYYGPTSAAEESIKRWWAPERILNFETSQETDVCSFGVLMYEISTGKEPELSADLVGLEGNRICAKYTALMQKCLHRY
ncbi:kinase-like domain-containing protein [Gamsiella multidivaricata]|uniref:kinase-like domain-containing protein n=1 Tax=Gamsiella multidivaricata TaxID=101098 RepID=UPI0022211EDC|nr:kinase-like domain-containing protein [Gamsiella multidivaricata]KAI7816014.1 kinase-like domain-containing protein [Gamsiella multidivaricata]